jgi:hypothetical protein
MSQIAKDSWILEDVEDGRWRSMRGHRHRRTAVTTADLPESIGKDSGDAWVTEMVVSDWYCCLL